MKDVLSLGDGHKVQEDGHEAEEGVNVEDEDGVHGGRCSVVLVVVEGVGAAPW